MNQTLFSLYLDGNSHLNKRKKGLVYETILLVTKISSYIAKPLKAGFCALLDNSMKLCTYSLVHIHHKGQLAISYWSPILEIFLLHVTA